MFCINWLLGLIMKDCASEVKKLYIPYLEYSPRSRIKNKNKTNRCLEVTGEILRSKCNRYRKKILDSVHNQVNILCFKY